MQRYAMQVQTRPTVLFKYTAGQFEGQHEKLTMTGGNAQIAFWGRRTWSNWYINTLPCKFGGLSVFKRYSLKKLDRGIEKGPPRPIAINCFSRSHFSMYWLNFVTYFIRISINHSEKNQWKVTMRTLQFLYIHRFAKWWHLTSGWFDWSIPHYYDRYSKKIDWF